MRSIAFTATFVFISFIVEAQDNYYPPTLSSEWETMPPDSLGWCQGKVDELMTYLEEQNTKAFILLKNGRIVIESYFGDFTAQSIWYWASAGKTLAGFTVGVAQEQGFLSISDPTYEYLGRGWTQSSAEQEEKITIWHQLTMTSGLDDQVEDSSCTLASCLFYKTDPGTRWAYHNGPYTLLGQVVSRATGETFNSFVNANVLSPIGGQGLFLPVGFDNIFFSQARTMARFGLLLLSDGKWNGETVLGDQAFLNAMVRPSQSFNQAYGYLTWLNGQNSFQVPGLQVQFDGSIMREAPIDTYAAIGLNGQLINVAPSENMVFIRMGESPSLGGTVPLGFNREIWARIADLNCVTTDTESAALPNIQLFPNPVSDVLKVQGLSSHEFILRITDFSGRELLQSENQEEIDVSQLPSGIYLAKLLVGDERIIIKKFVRQ